MKKYIEERIEIYLEIIGIAALVTFGWQLLEIAMIGKINSNSVDTVVSMVLIISLYGNLKYWKRSRK